MTLLEQRDIIQAAIDGRAIQMRTRGQGEPQTWADRQVNTFNFGHYEYRLKPVPREWWLATCEGVATGAYDNAYAAKIHSDGDKPIRVREVLDDAS